MTASPAAPVPASRPEQVLPVHKNAPAASAAGVFLHTGEKGGVSGWTRLLLIDSGVGVYSFSVKLMQPVGQLSTQVPQPVHFMGLT